MILLTVVVALLFDHFGHRYDAYRQHQWFDKLGAVLNKRLTAGHVFEDALRLLIGIFLPVMVLALAYHYIIEYTYSLVAIPLGSIILWHSLGPRNFGASYREQLRNKDDKSTAIINQLLVSAASKIFLPLFWCVLFGPVAAFAARLIQRQLLIDDEDLDHKDSFEPLLVVLMWPAAQLLSLSYVLVGHFTPALAVWRGYWNMGGLTDYNRVRQQLRDTGRAAVCMDDNCSTETSHALADESVGLVVRALVLWVFVIALITMGGIVS